MKIHKQVAIKSKKVRKCRRCGQEIVQGLVYYWIKHRNRSKEYFCNKHYPRPQDLTTSDKLAALYGAQDEISEAVEAINNIGLDEISDWQGTSAPDEPEFEEDDEASVKLHDEWEENMKEWEIQKDEYTSLADDLSSALSELSTVLQSAADTARETGDGYGESADNMEQYFPGSQQVDDIREKGDACQAWADELESASSDVESKSTDFTSDDPDGENLMEIRDEAATRAEEARDALEI